METSPSPLSNNNRLYDVAFIRALAVILVVFFHAYAMMYAPAHFPDTICVYKSFYYNVNGICLWFHMPLFIFISGYLYAWLRCEKGKYQHWGNFLWGKVKRLLIPFWIFTCVISLATDSFEWSNFITGGYSHLWFITMLFNCFWLMRLLDGFQFLKKSSVQIGLLLMSFGALFLPRELPRIMGLYNLPAWFFWFILGWVAFVHRESWYHLIRRFHLGWMFMLIYVACMSWQICYVGAYGYEERTLVSEIGFVAAVLLIWYSVNWSIAKWGEGWTQTRFVVSLGTCSYGIYIFHNWIEPYMISRTAKKLLPLEQWAADCVVLFPLLFSLLALLISWGLSRAFLKTRMGRFLIG